jgi:hypothetical protein
VRAVMPGQQQTPLPTAGPLPTVGGGSPGRQAFESILGEYEATGIKGTGNNKATGSKAPKSKNSWGPWAEAQ